MLVLKLREHIIFGGQANGKSPSRRSVSYYLSTIGLDCSASDGIVLWSAHPGKESCIYHSICSSWGRGSEKVAALERSGNKRVFSDLPTTVSRFFSRCTLGVASSVLGRQVPLRLTASPQAHTPSNLLRAVSGETEGHRSRPTHADGTYGALKEDPKRRVKRFASLQRTRFKPYGHNGTRTLKAHPGRPCSDDKGTS